MTEQELEFLRESNYIEDEYRPEALEDSVKAWRYTLQCKKMALEDVLRIHKQLMATIRPDIAGQLRRVNVRVGMWLAPNPGSVRRMLYQWLPEANSPSIMEEYLRDVHVMFERIHPFEDGNGRVGRILYNWQRVRNGLPIHVIHEGEEQRENGSCVSADRWETGERKGSACRVGGLEVSENGGNEGNPEEMLIYRSKRVGQNGRIFDLLKFRTMVENADQIGGSSTSDDDPRITKIGRLLRKTKADELPQLWNWLKGDISIVGPRPEVPEVINMMDDNERGIILSIRPGITDLATIWNNDEGALLKGEENPHEVYLTKIWPKKKRLQIFYIRNRNWWLDIIIIFQTILKVCRIPLIILPKNIKLELERE